MGLSDNIEQFIIELLKNEEDGCLELKRNELAGIFNCVPSQINYVMSTRFNRQRGYDVESRRGGGGYIRIRKIYSDTETGIDGVIERIGDSVDFAAAESIVSYLYERGILSEREARIILAGIDDKSIVVQQPNKNILRANILKNMLSVL